MTKYPSKMHYSLQMQLGFRVQRKLLSHKMSETARPRLSSGQNQNRRVSGHR